MQSLQVLALHALPPDHTCPDIIAPICVDAFAEKFATIIHPVPQDAWVFIREGLISLHIDAPIDKPKEFKTLTKHERKACHFLCAFLQPYFSHESYYSNTDPDDPEQRVFVMKLQKVEWMGWSQIMRRPIPKGLAYLQKRARDAEYTMSDFRLEKLKDTVCKRCGISGLETPILHSLQVGIRLCKICFTDMPYIMAWASVRRIPPGFRDTKWEYVYGCQQIDWAPKSPPRCIEYLRGPLQPTTAPTAHPGE